MGLAEMVSREAIYIAAVARTLALTRPVHLMRKLTIADWIERWAKERPKSPAVLYEVAFVAWRARCGRHRYEHAGLSLGLLSPSALSSRQSSASHQDERAASAPSVRATAAM